MLQRLTKTGFDWEDLRHICFEMALGSIDRFRKIPRNCKGRMQDVHQRTRTELELDQGANNRGRQFGEASRSTTLPKELQETKK